jgi:ABC-type multidrug transport system ATPase subunit/ABC-type multidrug transport system permease subunit
VDCIHSKFSSLLIVWLTDALQFYGFGALCTNEFAGHVYDCPVSEADKISAACIEYDGDFILKSLDIPANWLWKPILALIGLILLLAVLSILVLQCKHETTQVSRPTAEDEKARPLYTARSHPQDTKTRSVSIELQDICLDLKNGRGSEHVTSQPVICDLSVNFKAGSLNAILGPSGSGKSTLLNFMAKRSLDRTQQLHHRAGSMLLNGTEVTNAVLRSVSAYVPQDDAGLLPLLTVRETLRFAARMRLPTHLTKTQRRERVDSLISDLGLKACADTVVGNELVRGISGGERRRVSIAIQILADPLILLLDEPTSGLDSVTASSIIDVLEDLALRGCTIIFALHQPQTEWLSRFDTTLLLSKGGKVAYTGATDKMLDHFADLGVTCPQYENPADFALDVITHYSLPSMATRRGHESLTSKRRSATITAWQEGCYIPALLQSSSVDSAPMISQAAQLGVYSRQPLSITKVLPLLLHRSVTSLRRQPTIALGRTFQIMGLAITNLIFFAPLHNDYFSIQSRMGVIQTGSAALFVGMLNAIAFFPPDQALFYREEIDNLYSPESFFISYTLIELPSELVGALLFALLTVFGIGMPHTVELFFAMTLGAFCVVSCGESIGIALMTFISHPGLAVTACCVLVSVLTNLAGVIAITLPAGLKQLSYASPLKWMLGGIAPYALRGVEFSCNEEQQLADGSCPIENGVQVLELYHLNVNPGVYLGVLFGVTVAYRLGAYAILRLRRPCGKLVRRVSEGCGAYARHFGGKLWLL